MKNLIKKMIKTGDFCKMKNSKIEGLVKDQFVYIAGTQVIPEDRKDLYTQRIKFIVAPLEGNHVIGDSGLYLIDPSSIVKLHKNKMKFLMKTMKEDFGTKEEVVDDGNVLLDNVEAGDAA